MFQKEDCLKLHKKEAHNLQSAPKLKKHAVTFALRLKFKKNSSKLQGSYNEVSTLWNDIFASDSFENAHELARNEQDEVWM